MPFILRLVSEPRIGARDVLDLRPTDDWSPVVSATNAPVTETIPIILEAASDNAMAALLKRYQRLMDDARYDSSDTSAFRSVYLEWSMEGETGVYDYLRRYVYTIDFAFDRGMWFSCGEGYFAPNLHAVLTLTVTGWWEAQTFLEEAAFGTPLLSFPLSNTYGDSAARLRSAATGEGSINLAGDFPGQLWIAFRSTTRHGDVSTFEYLWELEAGTPGTDAALAMHAGGSPNDLANNCVEVNPAAATFIERVVCTHSDIVASVDRQANYGRFLVLLRAAVSGTAVFRVQVQGELMAFSGEIHTLDAADASTTEWRILDTGLIVQFPPGNQRLIGQPISMADTADFGFSIYASRVSGAGNLYLDTLILLPVDEYFLYWDRDPGADPAIGGFRIILQAFNDDSHYGWQIPAGLLIAGPDLYVNPPTVLGEGVPHDPEDDEVCVYAIAASSADQGGTNALANSFVLGVTYIPRYKSARGAL